MRVMTFRIRRVSEGGDVIVEELVTSWYWVSNIIVEWIGKSPYRVTERGKLVMP